MRNFMQPSGKANRQTNLFKSMAMRTSNETGEFGPHHKGNFAEHEDLMKNDPGLE